MKLTTSTRVSVDGVMQANGGKNPVFDPGFERGGWARPLFDSEALAFVEQTYQQADRWHTRRVCRTLAPQTPYA